MTTRCSGSGWAVLDASPEVEVVGEAVDGAELLAVVAWCAPDVVLTDLGRT
jgi:chemotaxis response regulator CheB